jgi:ABC-type lipoprotein release transport system permease subunit
VIRRVSLQYALRSLGRHPRRTVLSVIGVGVGCSIGLIATAYYRGAAELQVRAASESGAGHLRVVPAAWPETRENRLRLVAPDRVLAELRAMPEVRHTAPRARASALLAFGNRTAGVEMVGVVPSSEEASSRIVRKSRIEGRYLRDDDRGCVVIGKALARRLDVGANDDLLATLSGRDEMGSAMLRVVDLLDTGSRDLDLGVCQVTLEDLARSTGYETTGDISILLADYRRIEAVRRALAGRLPAGDAVVSWTAINPEIAANIRGDTGFFNFLSFVIVVMVVLGIASAQLAAVLERRHEFGVLMALGMRGRQVGALILLEAVLTGLAGAVVALGLGGGIAYRLATRGINFAALMGGDLSFSNVLFDPYLYGDFGFWLVGYAVGVCVAATLLAALYPCWFAARTDPARAMRTV